MKKVSKKASMAVMGLATLGILGISGLSASANSSNSGDGLASRLANRFGLNKEEVSRELYSYKTEQKDKHKAEVKAKVSANLQVKVDDGTITAEQKTAIEAKLEDLRKTREMEREANNNSAEVSKPNREEMKSRKEAQRLEMETWLKEQGINLDLKDVFPAHSKR